MTDYNATITFARPWARAGGDPWVDDLIDALAGYSPAVAGDNRETRVIISGPAVNVRQATTTALALANQAAPGVEVVGLEVVTTAEFDRRLELPVIPPLLSVVEAADRLGVSRQAVLQRLDSGTLHGTKVGATWVILEAALPRRAT